MKTAPLPTDVLVIGSGIGGLSTAIILAKLGCRVRVVEKNDQPGGLLRSYRRDGIDCSVGVHYLGSLANGQILRRFFDYLGVTEDIPVQRMGKGGIIDRYLLNPFSAEPLSFDVPEGIDNYIANLQATFPSEARQITALRRPLREAAQQLHSLDILYGEQGDFALLDQAEPLGPWLAEFNFSPALRSVLAVPACWLGVDLADCPIYYHNMALASYLSSSWRLTGSGADMALALARRLRQLGGEIVTRAEVADLLVTDRVVKGIRLSSGEELSAETVIGAIHPKAVLGMLPSGAVKPAYRQRISSLVDTYGICATHVRLDSNSHPVIPYNLFNLDTDKAGKIMDLRYYQLRPTPRPEFNLLSILTSGRDELWQPWQQTRSGQRGAAYEEQKAVLATELLQEAGKLLGPLSGAKVLDTNTPLTMRDWVNSPGGSAYGVLRSASQSLATALLNRTSVRGLYLAGQSVMAPGIIGTIMGSFATVKLLLGADEFKQQVIMP